MTDLTDRMRTCAAAILASDVHEYDDEVGRMMRDAAALLIEASNIIEEAQLGTVLVDDETAKALGLPMEVIPPVVQQPRSKASEESMRGTWITAGNTLPVANPYRSARACPKCDSRANKTVRRAGSDMMLICPVCAHEWPYVKRPLAEGPGAAE